MSTLPDDVRSLLQEFSQLHLVHFWERLGESDRQQLLTQLRGVDFLQLRGIWEQSRSTDTVKSAPSACERISRAAAPTCVIHQPGSATEQAHWKKAETVGNRELRKGKVAIVTVAGGQGTRLGFEHPKGMFPIGPVSDRSLFQIFAEQIQARRKRHQAALPWLIMTSDTTHDETVQFFREKNYFGLPEQTIAFFRQGSLPAIDAATGRILLNGPASLALSPDGHGGLISALQNSGLLNRMQLEGIEHVFYHQVDNPTAILADPMLIGFHVEHQSRLTTNVVCKTSPAERMGVLVELDGHTEIIEYSELTPEQAASHDASGQWIFWAGNTAIHVFDRSFLQQLAAGGGQLPLHAARKNVAFIDAEGQLVQPSDATNPNAIKLERFIFDALPLAERTLIVEGNRDREFNPVKNSSGPDSAETARAALIRIAHGWLAAAGYHLDDGVAIEISPLQALDAADLKDKLASGDLSLSEIMRQSKQDSEKILRLNSAG